MEIDGDGLEGEVGQVLVPAVDSEAVAVDISTKHFHVRGLHSQLQYLLIRQQELALVRRRRRC